MRRFRIMATHAAMQITSSDRMEDGIVVFFADGKSAFYSCSLLYATLPQARAMPSNSEGDHLFQVE